MKQLFSTSYNNSLANIWLLLLRLCVGGFMLTHGIPKFEKLMAGGEIQFADPFGLGATTSFVLTVFAEALCSILIAIGLATRLAAVPLIVTMAVAAFIQHGADPFAKKELALLYLLIYITILVFGPGIYSLDAMINKGGGKKKPVKGKK